MDYADEEAMEDYDDADEGAIHFDNGQLGRGGGAGKPVPGVDDGLFTLGAYPEDQWRYAAPRRQPQQKKARFGRDGSKDGDEDEYEDGGEGDDGGEGREDDDMGMATKSTIDCEGSSYCYLCETDDDPSNDIRQGAIDLIADLYGTIHEQAVCVIISRYYTKKVARYTGKEWTPRQVHEHIMSHTIDAKRHAIHDARVFWRVQSTLEGKLRRTDDSGREMLPDEDVLRQLTSVIERKHRTLRMLRTLEQRS